MNTDIKKDIKMMRRALALAKRGAGRTSPNPMVGAVIVLNGTIIGEGWHHICGQAHAEINALSSINAKYLKMLADATLYVTLEPCSTVGRTGACCDAIKKAKIGRVVIGCLDPNPVHAGKGVEILRSAGIEVLVGVCEDACLRLNAPFMKWIVKKEPYVFLKMAETLDGKIATKSGKSKWITGDSARRRVMQLRMISDAILAGGNTWKTDNPRFTVRDRLGRVIKTPRLFAATHAKSIEGREKIQCVKLDTREEWKVFLQELGASEVLMLLIEGGGELASSALLAGVVDEVEYHIAPKLLGGRDSKTSMEGNNPDELSEAIMLDDVHVRRLGEDIIVKGKPRKKNA